MEGRQFERRQSGQASVSTGTAWEIWRRALQSEGGAGVKCPLRHTPPFPLHSTHSICFCLMTFGCSLCMELSPGSHSSSPFSSSLNISCRQALTTPYRFHPWSRTLPCLSSYPLSPPWPSVTAAVGTVWAQTHLCMQHHIPSSQSLLLSTTGQSLTLWEPLSQHPSTETQRVRH